MQSYDEIAMQSLDFADLTPPSNFLNEFTRFTRTVKLDPWAAEIREFADKSHPWDNDPVVQTVADNTDNDPVVQTVADNTDEQMIIENGQYVTAKYLERCYVGKVLDVQ